MQQYQSMTSIHQGQEPFLASKSVHELAHNLRKFARPASDEVTLDMRLLSYRLPFDNLDGGAWKQGWDVNPVPLDPLNPLRVFVIPHSHCDPGWIQTFDEYFQQRTKHIIDSVIEALAKDPRRKFIWAEISYFSWWWKDQTHETKELVRRLLQQKQLEFVTGGWVMPDEANSQYYAMEIQLQEGHDWIRDNLGNQYIPKYGWSIDPFGYSPTNAYLLKKFGFRGMLIQRVHYHIKKVFAQNRTLEFLWRQTWDSDGEYDMFTHLMPFFSYDIPHTCGPDPSVCCQFDFARHPVGVLPACPWRKPVQTINEGNLAERSMLLLDQYQKKAALYRSNVVLVPLGDDFRYSSATETDDQYTNHQKIHDYLNENVAGVEISFGTLSDYFEAVQGKFKPPILKGSFFTYSDVNEDYWSGYFTSRAFDKALDRRLERALFAAESMGATPLELREPRRQLSLFQHHDGVTGTAKPHVVQDYAKRMHEAIQFTEEWALQRLRNGHNMNINAKHCWKARSPRALPENLCDTTQAVYLYNPLHADQYCNSEIVPGLSLKEVSPPCDHIGAHPDSTLGIKFDPISGLMIEPIREEWKEWQVQAGGAYLFVPGKLVDYQSSPMNVEHGGYVASSPSWSRTVIERHVPTQSNTTATVIDFIYEAHVTTDNREWLVRFCSSIRNGGIFHTDLNGFNFDTHYFRSDMPIQSQVFPMPTHASIEDNRTRMTILSEHAQGTASLQEGCIDIFLDRRLSRDDNRGLGEGVRDTVPTRTRMRLVLEQGGFQSDPREFTITPFCQSMWDEIQHPPIMLGIYRQR